MATIFTGFLAAGSGTGLNFIEATGTGYARPAITLVSGVGSNVTNLQSQTFTATGTNWPLITQYGLFTLATGGTMSAWWMLASSSPFQLTNAGGGTASHVVAASSMNLVFNSTYAVPFYENIIVGNTSVGPIMAPVNTQNNATYVTTGVLPTADPHSLGALFTVAGVVNVSAG